MQRVPELVEERAHFVDGQQRRLTGRRLGDVEVVDHHRLLAEQVGLVDERVHPGAAALGRAVVVVAEEEPDRRAVLVVHLEDPHVRVVADQVGALGQPQPVDLARGVEDAVPQHPFQLEVRPQRALVDVVLGLADLLRVVLPVPRLQPLTVAQGGAQRLGFLAGVGHRRRHQPGEQVVDRLRGARVPVLQHLRGMAGLAQQRGPPGPRRGEPYDEFAVGVETAAERGGQQPLAHRAVLQRGQLALVGEQLEAEHVTALVAKGGGVLGGARHRVGGQPGQLRGVVQDQRPGLGVGQQVLLEGGPRRRQLGVQLPQLLLALFGQPGAGPDELAVVVLQQPERLRVETELGAGLVQRVEAGEQRPVQVDGVVMRREPGAVLGVQRLRLRRGVG